ncbi:hypothetical protein BT96DRAFT_973923 [Gymnopus androsaceus JB14]|uniref:Uncharacterized protein n=1 Tax=Gymnopus androsaceus JB14 TaxID=1447944 RepID=A0A6A4HXM4_9AGAR|nr:hypothetical protein BT96DRAFT_973923 [Gymnopus androsaceus JB14]
MSSKLFCVNVTAETANRRYTFLAFIEDRLTSGDSKPFCSTPTDGSQNNSAQEIMVHISRHSFEDLYPCQVQGTVSSVGLVRADKQLGKWRETFEFLPESCGGAVAALPKPQIEIQNKSKGDDSTLQVQIKRSSLRALILTYEVISHLDHSRNASDFEQLYQHAKTTFEERDEALIRAEAAEEELMRLRKMLLSPNLGGSERFAIG